MKGTLYIDGIDAYTAFGAYPTDGALKAVIGWPSSKTPDYNDWQEEDGIEADLSDGLTLESRDVNLSLASNGFYEGYLRLLELLGDNQCHTFEFRSIGRVYKLRWTEKPSAFSHLKDLATLTLRFREDDPTQHLLTSPGTIYSHPVYCDDYDIDDIPVSELGFSILKGSRDDVYKHSSLKAPLVRTFSSVNGSIVDTEAGVRFNTRELKMRCFMNQPLEKLWSNYDELLRRMIQPEARIVDAAFVGEPFACYYKSCSIDAFSPDGEKAWLQFTITFVAVDGARLTTDWLLATEDDIFIVLEDEPEDTERGYILMGKNEV